MFEEINDAVFKMTWLSDLLAALLSGLGLDLSTPLGASVHFFCYDTVKIAILLVAVIFLISYVQSYFPPERTRRLLAACAAWAPTWRARCWAPSRPSARARRSPSSSGS